MKIHDKCDNCKNWVLGCELDGEFRRSCIKDNYDCYNPIIRKPPDNWMEFGEDELESDL